MPSGIIKRLMDDRGFGFIKPDDGSRDVFFHASAVVDRGFNQLVEGQAVEYDVRIGNRGPQAAGVRPLESHQQVEPARAQKPSYRFLNPYNFVRLMPLKPAESEAQSDFAEKPRAALPGASKLDTRLLGRCQPPPHDRYVGITGKITCTLENTTPLFISNSEGIEQHGMHHSYEFFKLDGKPAIPASSLRGMIRSVFEAATNSCMAIMASETRLSYHFPPREALKLVPARVVHEKEEWKLQLLPGATPFRVGQPPAGLQYAAWVPSYLGQMIRDRRNTPSETPYGQRQNVALNGLKHKDRCWAFLKHITHPNERRRFAFWNVEQVAKSQDELPRPQAEDERVAEGYLCINNQNIENKHDERFFFFSGGLNQARLVDLPKCVRKDYTKLIEDYQQRHRDHVAKRSKPEERDGQSPAFSRFIVHEEAKSLNHGDLVYAMCTEKDKVDFIVPVSVPRLMYDRTIGDVLANANAEQLACSKTAKLCPACRVFGWVDENALDQAGLDKPVAYASRVTFSHGRSCSPAETLPPTPLAILSSPKPTTTRFYLQPNHDDSPPKTWEARGGYDGHVKLRGRKFYRHHGEAKEIEYRRAGNKSDDQNRTVRDALQPGARFGFKIRFENLAAIELGALLWALEMDRDTVHRLGFAKPLGFGSVKIRVENLQVLDPRQRYATLRERGWHTIDDWQDVCVRPFKEAMAHHYRATTFNDLASIIDLKAILSGPLDNLPIHYPRMSREPHPDGKNFEWFMGNNSERHGLKLTLPPAFNDGGFPLIRRDGVTLD